MVLIGVSYFPHGAMILDPHKEGLPASAVDLHNQCVEAAKVIVELSPDIIILVTPHGLATSSSLSIYQNYSFRGDAGWLGHWEEFCVECSNVQDTLIEDLIKQFQSAGISCEGLSAFSRGVVGPLAWGEVVPLWFHRELLNSNSGKATRVIVLSIPQRRLTDTLAYCESDALETGRMIARLCQASGNSPSSSDSSLLADQRVCLLVSGDLSHVHGCDPMTTPEIYQGHPSLGTDPELARAFDQHLVEEWAKKVFIEGLLTEESLKMSEQELLHSEIVREKVVDAKLCGFAGLCIIQGCLQKYLMQSKSDVAAVKGQVFGYAAPTYYGMLVAAMCIIPPNHK